MSRPSPPPPPPPPYVEFGSTASRGHGNVFGVTQTRALQQHSGAHDAQIVKPDAVELCDLSRSASLCPPNSSQYKPRVIRPRSFLVREKQINPFADDTYPAQESILQSSIFRNTTHTDEENAAGATNHASVQTPNAPTQVAPRTPGCYLVSLSYLCVGLLVVCAALWGHFVYILTQLSAPVSAEQIGRAIFYAGFILCCTLFLVYYLWWIYRLWPNS